MVRRRKSNRLGCRSPVALTLLCASALLLLLGHRLAAASSFDQMAFGIESIRSLGTVPIHPNADLDLLWSPEERALQRKPAFGFSQLTDDEHTLYLKDGTNFGQTVTYIFRPETGRTIDEYDFVVTSSNEEVLLPEDAVRTAVFEEVDGIGYYNVTYEFNFNRFPGRTTFEVAALPNYDIVESPTRPSPPYQSLPVDFLIPGIVIYDIGSREVLSGEDSTGINVDYDNVAFTEGTGETIPGVSQFGVFIQYPDGTTSNDPIGEDKIPSLSGVQVTIENEDRGFVAYDPETCSFDGARWTESGTEYEPGCNLGVTGSYDSTTTQWPGLFFGFNPERYKADTSNILIEWPGFDSDPDSDEIFSTNIPITIGGNPPPILFDVVGPEYLLSEGGQEITVTFSNGGYSSTDALREFLVDETDLSLSVKAGSFVDNGETQQVTFVTGTGEPGQDVPYVFEVDGVPAVDLSTVKYTFYYAELPSVDSADPNQGPVDGGSIVQLSGTFEGFDPIRGDTVAFSNYRLDDSSIIDFSNDFVVFELPPQSEIGSETVYDLQVQIGESVSGSVPFYYEIPPTVGVVVTGDVVQDSSGGYTVKNDGTFAITTQVEDGLISTADGTSEITYEWSIDPIESDEVRPANVIGLDLTAPSLELPSDRFPTGVSYLVTVTVTNGLGLSDGATVVIERGDIEFNGINIRFDGMPTRTRGEPLQPVQVTADIELINPPEGVAPNMTFAWTYSNGQQSQEFVVTSDTVERDVESSGPSRLGQEFYVTQKELPYGAGELTFRLNAYLTDRPDLGNTITGKLRIARGRIIATINNGQDTVRVSPTEQIQLSGSSSRDVDILEEDNIPFNDGLTYNWLSCRKSLSKSFEEFDSCFDEVLSGVGDVESLTIPEGVLDDIKMSDDDMTYFEITMRARKLINDNDVRDNSLDTIILELEPDATTITSVQGIELTNAAGDPVDPEAVNYLDSLVVSPIAPDGATWEFRFTSPPQARSFVDEVENLFSDRTVYYGGTTSRDKPLGILPGKLEPNTLYILAVRSISAASFDSSNEVTVSLKTTQQPSLNFPPIANPIGTITTTFSVTAGASISSPFLKFYFFASKPELSERICLGSCNGASTVSFQIKQPGTYEITAELRDANTQGLFDSQPNFDLITVTEPAGPDSESISNLDSEVDTCYAASDDGCVLAGINAMIDALESESRQVREDDGENAKRIQKNIGFLLQLSNNSIPNIEFGRSLVVTAKALSRLGPQYVTDGVGVFSLLSIVQSAIVRSPKRNALKIYIDPLRDFSNFTLALAYNSDVQGSTRRRLLQEEVNVVGLQSAVSVSDNFAEVSGRKESCGYIDEFDTGVLEGVAGVDPLYVRMMKYCNPDQLAKPLQGLSGFSDFTITCPDILAPTAAKYTVVLTESGNYAGQAGAYIASADTVGLTRISTQRGTDELPDQSGCYQVRQNIGEFTEDLAPKCFRLTPEVGDNEDCDDDLCYQPSTEGIETTFTNEFMIAKTDSPTGLFSCLRRAAQAPTPEPTEEDRSGQNASFTPAQISGVVVGILLFLLLALLVAWIVATRCFAIIAVPPPADNFEYVERDIYGRGFVIEQSAYDPDAPENGEEGFEPEEGAAGIELDEENADAPDEVEFEVGDD